MWLMYNIDHVPEVLAVGAVKIIFQDKDFIKK